MANVVQNPLLTTNANADLKKRDVFPEVIKLYPDEAKFLIILDKLGKRRPVHASKYEMMEEDIEIFSTGLASDVTAGATTITVTTGHGVYFAENDVIILMDGATQEQAIVSSVSGDTLTLTVGLTNGFAAATTEIIRTAKAVPEYGNVSTGITIEPSLGYNYAQLFDESFELSERQIQEWDYYTKAQKEAVLKYHRDRMMGRFLRGIARAFYFGIREKRTGSNGANYLTGGLNYFVSTTYDATGLTEENFRAELASATMKGSDRRILLCSSKFIEVFNSWKLADRFIPQGNNTLGFKTNSYINDYCELTIVMDKTLTMTKPDWAFLIDPKYVGIAELKQMSKKISAQPNDKYSYKEGVNWYAGFDIANEGAFVKFVNVGS